MEEVIGTNAGLVWSVLSQQGKMDMKGLRKVSKLKDKDVWAALGWLARESKVSIKEVEDEIVVQLVG
jgi:hypothetical protein